MTVGKSMSQCILLKVAKVVATCSIIVSAASAAGITARRWLQGCKPLQYHLKISFPNKQNPILN